MGFENMIQGITDMIHKSGYRNEYIILVREKTQNTNEKRERAFSMRKTETMLSSWWTSFLCTKRSKIAVCSSSINNRRWILTSPHGCLWILKCDLRKDQNFMISETRKSSEKKIHANNEKYQNPQKI